MKIAIIGTDLAALHHSVGALEKLCLGWARGLTDRGAEIMLFSIDDPNLEFDRSLPISHFRSVEDLMVQIKLYGPDVAIANNRPMWDLHSKYGKINIFHNYPDAWATSDSNSSGNILANLHNSKNLAVSKALANHIEEIYHGVKTDVLYPFLEDSFLNPLPRKQEEESNVLRVLFPNRTLEKKGLRWVIDTFDALLSDSARLTVVKNISPWTTATHEHKSLLELAESRRYVEIIEKLSDTDSLISLYQCHDVVLTPSVQEEGLGLIPLEAQALGVPVVCTNLGGLPESTFPPNATVDPFDYPALAESILTAPKIDEPSRLRIRQRIAELFSFENSLSTLINAIESLLNGDGFS